MPRVEINMVEGDHSVDEKLAFMKKAESAGRLFSIRCSLGHGEAFCHGEG